MRWIGASCVLVLGCSFNGPSGGSPDAGRDGPPGMDGMPPDGPPTSPVRTRKLEIADAQVMGGPHADFPLLVSITADWLREKAAGGGVASPSGFDLGFFADAAGATRLAHELVAYRSEAATGTLVAWVKVPSLSAASELFLRYGDPAITTSQEDAAAVWSNGFGAVWHLDDDLDDSTSNANTGTASGASNTGGQIEGARGFDGVDDAVELGSGASIDNVFTGGGTVEAWFRASGWGESDLGRIFAKGDASGWLLSVTSGSLLFAHESNSVGNSLGTWFAPMSAVMLNAWTHVAVVYDKGSAANDPSIYLNGTAVAVLQGNSPSSAMSSDDPFNGRIGNRTGGGRAFNGRIDEVRLSRTARGADWISTSFRNQSAPDAFLTVGPER